MQLGGWEAGLSPVRARDPSRRGLALTPAAAGSRAGDPRTGCRVAGRTGGMEGPTLSASYRGRSPSAGSSRGIQRRAQHAPGASERVRAARAGHRPEAHGPPSRAR